jgi:hypothetical protein
MLTSIVAFGALAAGTARPADAATAPAGHWGKARQVPGLATLNAGQDALVLHVSCASPGNCAAAGTYAGSTSTTQVFFVEEKDGHWGKAVQAGVPDPATSDAEINAMSCDAPGDCAGGGNFDVPGSPSRGFIIAEQQGGWGTPVPVSGSQVSSAVDAASCAPRGGGCAAGGYIFSGPFNGPQDSVADPFVIDRNADVWGPVRFLDLSGLGASTGIVSGVSCATTGNCAAAGSYQDKSGATQTLLADERNGVWGAAQAVPGMSVLPANRSFPGSVSCGSPGNCVVAGTYFDDHMSQQVYVADEVDGQWGSPQQVPGTGKLNALGDALVGQVSCGSAGNCAVVGFYKDGNGARRAFEADERHGAWHTARPLAGAGPLANGRESDALTVSCASAGNCVAGGWFIGASDNTGQQAFTASEVKGTWGMAKVLPGSAALNQGKAAITFAVSCAAPGACAAGGSYFASEASETAFLADESPVTMTSVGLSAAKIRFGHEQGEQVSVTVSSRTGGPPGGRVMVSAGARIICVVTLAGGKGSCKLAARTLKPGRYTITAAYGGSATYDPSAAGAKTLTVTK